MNTDSGLRYRVYCTERAYEDPDSFPDGLEKDQYDRAAIHSVLRHRASLEVAGVVRLVRPNMEIYDGLLPIELHCRINSYFRKKISNMPREQIAEISRLAVSKQFRRRLGENQTIHEVIEKSEARLHCEERRSLMPLITLGLLRAIVAMSVEYNITYWLAVMEPQLIRLLRGFGVVLVPIGPMANYHGSRMPCAGAVSEILTGARRFRPDIWEFITQDVAIAIDSSDSFSESALELKPCLIAGT
jgi:N-acyl amino acid synthase of PEP-CTERM/exosortase system